MPKFTVLISVYKDELAKNFDDSLYSIYDAQVLKPSEIVIIKDGLLTEELELIIKKWIIKLPNIIKVYNLEKNSGLAIALNFGLNKCTNEIVARMDTDDISLPNRFASQVHFLSTNLNISVVSAFIEEFDTNMSVSQGIRRLPLKHAEIVKFAKSRNPISHPVAMFRKSAVQFVGGYPVFNKAQDYALWSLMIVKGFKLANLNEVLLKMRTGDGLLRRRGIDYFKNEAMILKFQMQIGFISWHEYFRNLLIRFFFRAQPHFIKAFLYRLIK